MVNESLPLKTAEIEKIEQDLLFEAIFRHYGYDFRNYDREFLKKRLKNFLVSSKQEKISRLIPEILYDENAFSKLVLQLLISVTEMFRDPLFFLEFRRKVIPSLMTYPFIKIWHAGCATGQEAYSMAILLEECGLLKRSTIYATDINPQALKVAREGIYPVEEMEKHEKNYFKAGGSSSLSNYFHCKYEYAKIIDPLKNKIIFSNHNLVGDDIFNEMHVILCRNVFIYFNKKLQHKTALLFHKSLIHKGFLCLGNIETLEFPETTMKFEVLSKKEKIFRKVGNF